MKLLMLETILIIQEITLVITTLKEITHKTERVLQEQQINQ